MASGFTAGSSKSVLWYAVLQLVMYKITMASSSSSIIKDLVAVRKAGLASVAYYYFDFKDTDKQDLHGLLSSLLLQLTA